MRELRPGLWHWQAPHPEGTPDEHLVQAVSSYALDDGERLLLFDPPGVPEELIELSGDRESAVALTAEQAAGGSPDLAWLLAGEGEGRFYAAGDRQPFGVEAFAARDRSDLILWIERVGAPTDRTALERALA
ncbi:MAG: hypothetical protein ICV67_06815 [Thermoleophilia bacterium]|nr:hypothetical protein [Thermoleophilia bacterium]